MTKKGSSVEIKKCIKKNMGFYTMCTSSKILEGTEIFRSFLPDDLSFDDIVFMQYALITSTNVKKRKRYKHFLADNWQSFLFDNIK